MSASIELTPRTDLGQTALKGRGSTDSEAKRGEKGRENVEIKERKKEKRGNEEEEKEEVEQKGERSGGNSLEELGHR